MQTPGEYALVLPVERGLLAERSTTVDILFEHAMAQKLNQALIGKVWERGGGGEVTFPSAFAKGEAVVGRLLVERAKPRTDGSASLPGLEVEPLVREFAILGVHVLLCQHALIEWVGG